MELFFYHYQYHSLQAKNIEKNGTPTLLAKSSTFPHFLSGTIRYIYPSEMSLFSYFWHFYSYFSSELGRKSDESIYQQNGDCLALNTLHKQLDLTLPRFKPCEYSKDTYLQKKKTQNETHFHKSSQEFLKVKSTLCQTEQHAKPKPRRWRKSDSDRKITFYPSRGKRNSHDCLSSMTLNIMREKNTPC